jgi:two-component system sensor histidine kinase TctE
MSSSLRLRLLCWLTIPLAIYVAVSAGNAYEAAVNTAKLVQERTLQASAEVIAGQVFWSDGGLAVDVPPSALTLFDSPYGDEVFYSVVDDRRRLLAGNPEFVARRPPSAMNPQFYETRLADRRLRAAQYTRAMFDSGHLRTVTVTVGQTLRGAEHLVDTLRLPALRRQIVMLALAIALVLVGLTFELRPLERVRNEVAGRDPMELETINARDLPRELRPIVDAINQCIRRLSDHVTLQKRFIADAAHQLRTPLAVLGAQLEFAERARGEQGLRDVHGAMASTTREMKNLANQLLLLSQAEAASAKPAGAMPAQSADLVAVASGVLEDLVVLAQAKPIDLGAEFAVARAAVGVNREMLHALVQNLVDNAIRYTPEHGCVTVEVDVRDGRARLAVRDDGPGITPEARPKVFERFYRNAKPSQEGTGLGLAIVKEIVIAAKGTIELDAGIGGKGLTVLVGLPLAA